MAASKQTKYKTSFHQLWIINTSQYNLYLSHTQIILNEWRWKTRDPNKTSMMDKKTRITKRILRFDDEKT